MANKTTFNQTPDYIEGTVADIIGRGKDSRLSINGKRVKQPDLSTLARLGLATEVGVAERPEGKRGPAPVIYRIPLHNPAMVVNRR
ncbi:predicted ORF [Xanthomonas phage XacN1]|nr:predicted ORF [Xanthomonas phage XacN1]BBA65659.1 predicted ORF [Xanthomonas phage XacN1]